MCWKISSNTGSSENKHIRPCCIIYSWGFECLLSCHRFHLWKQTVETVTKSEAPWQRMWQLHGNLLFLQAQESTIHIIFLPHKSFSPSTVLPQASNLKTPTFVLSVSFQLRVHPRGVYVFAGDFERRYLFAIAVVEQCPPLKCSWEPISGGSEKVGMWGRGTRSCRHEGFEVFCKSCLNCSFDEFQQLHDTSPMFCQA